MTFRNEVKDFLGAATSTYKALDDAQYNKIKRAYMKAQTDKIQSDLDDPNKDELAKAQIAGVKARTAHTNAAIGLTNQRRALVDRQIKAFDAPPPEDPVAAGISAPPARAIKPAIPTGDEPSVGPQSSLLDEDPQEGGDSTQFAATGGMVKKFADGGMVEDEDTDPTDEDDVSAQAPAIGGGATDFSAQSRNRGASISKDAGHDAVVAGLKYGVTQLGVSGVPTALRQQRLMALSRGAGAAPLADMNQIYKKIDPNNEMGESERNINAMSAIYQHKLKMGDAQGAQKAAFMMLQHYNIAAQRYAAIANAALQHGDVDGGVKAAMKAYANILDGRDLKITKTDKGLQYSFTDEKTGKVVSQGIATPEELAAQTLGIATKGTYPILLQAAGQRAPKEAVGKGTGAPKPKEAEDLRNATGSAVDAFAAKAKEAGKDIKDSEVTAMKNASYHISRSNDLTPEESFDAARTFITAPEPKKGKDGKTEPGAFKIKRDEDTGKNTITFADSDRDIVLSDAELRPLIAMRGKALKERAAAEEKPKGKGYGEMASEAGQAIGNVAKDGAKAVGAIGDAWGGAIARDARKFGQESSDALDRAKELNPALTSSVKRAVGAVQNPGDVPGVDNPL